MASRINTKFLLIVVAALIAGSLIIGTAWYLNARGSVTRNLKRGDEAYAAGNLMGAYDYYGRAIDKKPADGEILAKLQKTLLQIRPKTSDEANDRYGAYIQTLAHAARYNSSDPEAHLRLLREIYMSGRQLPYQETWERMISFADDMWRELPVETPERIHAKTYRALGRFRLVTQSTEDQLAEADHDIRDVIAADPKNDLAWSVLCMAQMQVMGRLKTEGRSADVLDKQLKKMDQTLKDAQAAVPDGPETATVYLYRLILKPGAEYEVVSSDEIKRAADRVTALVTDDADPGLVSTAADLLPGVPDDGFKRATVFLERYLKAHPEALDKRLRLAHQLYWSDELDRAEQVANQVIEAEPLPTSFVSRLQSAIRQQAAGVIVNAQARRWTLANDADKPARLAAMEESRAKLVALVSDPANDTQVLRADGKIAYAKGEYSKAAACFDRLARDPSAVDNEVLLYSVDCLDRIGELGLAYERLKTVLKSSPTNVPWLETKANMEVRMGRYDDAALTLGMLPQSELTKQNIRDLVTFVNSKTTRETGPQVEENPLIALVTNAYSMLNRGEFDNARATLQPELQKSPDNLQLLQAMTQVEMQAGKSDKAREYLDRALKLQPNNKLFLRFDATLKTSDPIDATRQYNTAAFEDERDRTIVMLFSMQSIVLQNELAAKRFAQSDPDRAAKARDIVARAREEIKSWEAKAVQLMPDDPKFIEYSFLSAVTDQDWPRTEQVVSRAKALNSDQAEGNLYQGRFLMSQGKFQDAIRALEIATDRISFSAVAWKMLGVAYESVSNYSQALRAFGEAYKCNPNDLDGTKGYFRMLVKGGDNTRALTVAKSLHELMPQDVQMRDMWLDFEAEFGDRFIALTERRKICREDPNDAENAKRLARLYSDTEPSRPLIVDDSGQPLYNEQRWGRMQSDEKDAAIASTRDQWNKQSDEILNRLGADGKEDIKLASLRAALLRRRGQVSEGEEVLNKYIATHKNDATDVAQLWMELARYQTQSSHFTQAVASYTEAIAHQDAKKREADRELAMLYMQLTDYQHALEHLDLVLAVDPAEQVQKQKVECLMKLGRFDDAEKNLQELMASKHGEHDLVTIMLAANIAEGRGNDLLSKSDSAGAERRFAEQREALARAEAFDPTSPTPRVFLAQSLLNEYRRTHRPTLLEDALQALARADKARPGTNDVSMVRVAILEERNDRPAAIGELRRMLDANPDNILARRALVQLHVDSRDIQSALGVIDDGIKANPTLAAWHETKGDVYHVSKEHSKALEAYDAACDITASPSLLRKIAETTFLVSNPDCKSLVDRLSPRTDDLNASPVLREYLARALCCDQRPGEALDQLRLAYKQRAQLMQEGRMKSADMAGWFQAVTFAFPSGTPGKLDASHAEQFVLELCKNAPSAREMQGIARLWLLAGDASAAHSIELFRQAIQQCPVTEKAQMVDLNIDLANVLLMTGDFEGAAAAYRDVLSLDPGNVGALNNIAFVTAQDLKDPAKALPYAEQAAQLAPQDGSVLDTVGWVHYLAGNTDKAQQYLTDSLRLDKFNAMTHVHMAELLVKTGDIDVAAKHLDEAEKQRLDPSTKAKVDTLRADIGKKRTPGG